jgi:beta-lactamase class A
VRKLFITSRTGQLWLAAAFASLTTAQGVKAATPGPAFSSQAQIAATPESDALYETLTAIAARNPTNVGIAAKHLESGRTISLNARSAFPMASTFKVAVAVRLLQLVDQGRLKLDDLIAIQRKDYVVASVLAERFNRGPVSVSLANLLELMLVLSDNTATDAVMRTVGGPSEVTAMLRRMGIAHMTVSHSTTGLLLRIIDYAPLTKLINEDDLSFAEAWARMSAEQQQEIEQIADRRSKDPAYVARVMHDPTDTATPAAMLDLLSKVWTTSALSEASAAILKDVLARVETGPARIKGKLPAATVVMHKTGTLTTKVGVTNDAGVIRLPDGKGTLALVVYTRNGDNSVEVNEAIISDAASAIYHYFVLTTPKAAR